VPRIGALNLSAKFKGIAINGSIFVALPTMASAEDDFRAVLNALQAQLDELDGQLRASLAEWSGDARAAYDVAHAAWQQATADMVKSLALLHEVIRTAHMNYQSARTTNVRMWRGS
jgi:6 kDa early secretory antigenic target